MILTCICQQHFLGQKTQNSHHKYGDNAKVAKDLKRINRGELLHHFHNNLPMEHCDWSKLGEGSVVQKIDKDSGIKARNNVHNRIQADVFLPGGSSSNTIKVHDYKQLLSINGTPSAPLIDEGANLSVTEEAHQSLFDWTGVINCEGIVCKKSGFTTSVSKDETYCNGTILLAFGLTWFVFYFCHCVLGMKSVLLLQCY